MPPDSNNEMAALTAEQLHKLRPELTERQVFERCRLAIEMGYGAIEMLLEEPEMDPDYVFKQVARAVMEVYQS